MDARIRVGLLTAALALCTGSLEAQTGAPGAAPADTLPPGVTEAMVQRGKTVFTGAGLCHACHGPDGKGSVGPSLADTVWIHNRGEFEAIVQVIQRGVPAAESKSHIVMPPRGGSSIKDEDVRAVAAYVWSLSRRR